MNSSYMTPAWYYASRETINETSRNLRAAADNPFLSLTGKRWAFLWPLIKSFQEYPFSRYDLVTHPEFPLYMKNRPNLAMEINHALKRLIEIRALKRVLKPSGKKHKPSGWPPIYYVCIWPVAQMQQDAEDLRRKHLAILEAQWQESPFAHIELDDNHLRPVERSVLEYRLKGQTFIQIAERLKVSRQWIAFVQQRAFRRLNIG